MVAPKRRTRDVRAKDEINFDALSAYFHLTLTEAASKLGICKSLLKMVCRKNGISRWPRRRLLSVEKSIAKLEDRGSSKRGCNKQVSGKIIDLQQSIRGLYMNPKQGELQGMAAQHAEALINQQITTSPTAGSAKAHALAREKSNNSNYDLESSFVPSKVVEIEDEDEDVDIVNFTEDLSQVPSSPVSDISLSEEGDSDTLGEDSSEELDVETVEFSNFPSSFHKFPTSAHVQFELLDDSSDFLNLRESGQGFTSVVGDEIVPSYCQLDDNDLNAWLELC